MRGRPKKYKEGIRVLLFLDKEVVDRLDELTNNKSDTINKLIKEYIDSKDTILKDG